MSDLKKRIGERAYQLYLERGGRYGDAVSDWLRAEKEIMSEARAEPKETKKPARKKKKGV
jgi:hypothetical protein